MEDKCAETQECSVDYEKRPVQCGLGSLIYRLLPPLEGSFCHVILLYFPISLLQMCHSRLVGIARPGRNDRPGRNASKVLSLHLRIARPGRDARPGRSLSICILQVCLSTGRCTPDRSLLCSYKFPLSFLWSPRLVSPGRDFFMF